MFFHNKGLQFEANPDQPDPVYAKRLQERTYGDRRDRENCVSGSSSASATLSPDHLEHGRGRASLPGA
jgi:Manganese containing catalase